jgi:hypothetical protein
MAADLFITCSCSQKLSVTPADCGGTLRCSCGRVNDVPRLSEVREMSELAAAEIVTRIKQGIVDGTLPVERNCITCKCQTSSKIFCELSCKHQVSNGAKGGPDPLVFILSPLIWLWLLIQRKPIETDDQVTLLKVPMIACEKCARKLQRSKRKRIKSLLETSLYRELFATYPNTSSIVVDSIQGQIAPSEGDTENPYSYR